MHLFARPSNVAEVPIYKREIYGATRLTVVSEQIYRWYKLLTQINSNGLIELNVRRSPKIKSLTTVLNLGSSNEVVDEVRDLSRKLPPFRNYGVLSQVYFS